MARRRWKAATCSLLAAIAIPLYANIQSRARIAKAQADARTLASAVSMYSATFGNIPAALADLASAGTLNGEGRPTRNRGCLIERYGFWCFLSWAGFGCGVEGLNGPTFCRGRARWDEARRVAA